MVLRRHIRAVLTIAFATFVATGFSSIAAQVGDRMATTTHRSSNGSIESSIVNGPVDAPPPAPNGLNLEVLASGSSRDRVTLRFTLPRAGIVRITLSTDDGREVGTLASGLSAAGDNRLELDVRKIPPGTYLLTLQTRGGNASTRLVIGR
jgi:hypothetical protein